MRLERLLVPTDFSEISLAAFNDAVILATHSELNLYHLHIVDNQKQVHKARIELEVISNKILAEHNVKVKNLVRIGEFMKSIGDVACEIDADLVIMGTHGLKGMQWFTGSNAMRILANCKAPILISQKSRNKLVELIVVPLDSRLETRQKLDVSIKLARAYQARIHLLIKRDKDSLPTDKVNKMIKQVADYISDHKVKYSLDYIENSITPNRLLDFAYKAGADLITIINYQEEVYTELFGVSREQELISNKYHIPVLCVNAKKTTEIITTY